MNDFLNVIKRDPQLQIKIKVNLDTYVKLSPIYQSKIGYDTLILNVILQEIINLMGIIFVDIDKKLKLKISRTEYLESRFLGLYTFIFPCYKWKLL